LVIRVEKGGEGMAGPEAAAALHSACGGDAGNALTELFRYLRQSGCTHMTDDDQCKEWIHEALARSAAGEKKNDDELAPMKVTVTPAAKRALEESLKKLAEEVGQPQVSEDIPAGTKCKRNGCKTIYQGPESAKKLCEFHPGTAIFHETYKYWSCCDTTRAWDWDDFQKIPTCRVGPELCAFTDDAPGLPKRAACRQDFFQVGTGVTWNIYAKKVQPQLSSFQLSKTHAKVNIVFDGGKVFNYYAKLSGKVVPDQCKVEIGGPKIEIALVKAPESSGAAWEKLGEEIKEETGGTEF